MFTIIEKIILTVIILVLSLMLFIYIPVAIHTQSDCLKKGYPESAVTLSFDRYCIGINGVAYSQVDKQ